MSSFGHVSLKNPTLVHVLRDETDDLGVSNIRRHHLHTHTYIYIYTYTYIYIEILYSGNSLAEFAGFPSFDEMFFGNQGINGS